LTRSISEIDGDRAGGLRHGEALGQPVDGDHLPCAEQNGTADGELADRASAPDRDRVGRLDVALHGALPAGREDIAQEQHLLVGKAAGHLDVGGVRERNAQIFGLAARIAAGEVGIAEQPGRAVAEDGVGQLLVAVRPLADRIVAPLALVALAAPDGEGHHDPVAGLERLVLRADLDHLPHHFMADDVAGFHTGHQVVEQVQVGTADGAARHSDDRVARMLDLGIGHGLVAYVLLAVPDERFHPVLPRILLTR
jgi:hypothetical protein